MEADIRRVLEKILPASMQIDRIDPAADLFDHGMTSFMATQVLMALEDAFAIEFPDEMMRRENFATISRINRSVVQLTSN